MKTSKYVRRSARKQRIRARVSGTAARPRLTVFCSLTSVYAQLIDDTTGKTLAAASSKDAKAKNKNIETATKVGEIIGKKAKDAKITAVVFDRNGRKYHGRVKALAEAARKSGLTF
jgi:large subunit ribosomal protein L18